MRLWDLTTGHCVYVLKTHTCADICFDDDKVITASFDNTVGMWDWKTGDVLQCFRGHTAAGNLEFKVHTLMISEVCVAEWLTPRTPDLEVRDSSLAGRVVPLDKELYFALSLFTQMYKLGTGDILLGLPYDGLASHPGGSSNTPTYFMLMKLG